jgi:hypothetical protein
MNGLRCPHGKASSANGVQSDQANCTGIGLMQSAALLRLERDRQELIMSGNADGLSGAATMVSEAR